MENTLKIVENKKEFKHLNTNSSTQNAPFIMKNNFPHKGVGNFLANKLDEICKQNINYKNILDVGCGTGWLSDVAPSHLSYKGVDTCSFFIEQLSQEVDNFYVFDVEATHSPDLIKNFESDVVVCCLSLIETSYLKEAFQNLSLLCKPGGTLFIVGLEPIVELHRISKNSEEFYSYLDMYLNNSNKLTISKKIKSKGEVSEGDYHRILYGHNDYHQLAKANGFVLEESDQIRGLEFKAGGPVYNYLLFKRNG